MSDIPHPNAVMMNQHFAKRELGKHPAFRGPKPWPQRPCKHRTKRECFGDGRTYYINRGQHDKYIEDMCKNKKGLMSKAKIERRDFMEKHWNKSPRLVTKHGNYLHFLKTESNDFKSKYEWETIQYCWKAERSTWLSRRTQGGRI